MIVKHQKLKGKWLEYSTNSGFQGIKQLGLDMYLTKYTSINSW